MDAIFPRGPRKKGQTRENGRSGDRLAISAGPFKALNLAVSSAADISSPSRFPYDAASRDRPSIKPLLILGIYNIPWLARATIEVSGFV